MEKIPVERVGLPGRAWLELKGTILLFHTQSWLGTTSIFIPLEWVTIAEGARRDRRRLWLALLSIMCAVLFALPAWLLLQLRPLHAPLAQLLTVLLLAVLLCAGLGLAALVAAFFPRPYVSLRVSSELRNFDIRIWSSTRHANLEELLNRLRETHAAREELIKFPIRMHHIWRRPRPYRIAIARGFTISAFLVAPLMLWDFAAHRELLPLFSPLVYGLLLAPPLFHGALVALRQAMWKEPASYRHAISAYLQERFKDAERHLRDTLQENNEHDGARLLLVQLLSEERRFDEAEQECGRLAQNHPLLASRLQASLWGLRRLQARMEEE